MVPLWTTSKVVLPSELGDWSTPQHVVLYRVCHHHCWVFPSSFPRKPIPIRKKCQSNHFSPPKKYYTPSTSAMMRQCHATPSGYPHVPRVPHGRRGAAEVLRLLPRSRRPNRTRSLIGARASGSNGGRPKRCAAHLWDARPWMPESDGSNKGW